MWDFYLPIHTYNSLNALLVQDRKLGRPFDAYSVEPMLDDTLPEPYQ